MMTIDQYGLQEMSCVLQMLAAQKTFLPIYRPFPTQTVVLGPPARISSVVH